MTIASFLLCSAGPIATFRAVLKVLTNPSKNLKDSVVPGVHGQLWQGPGGSIGTAAPCGTGCSVPLDLDGTGQGTPCDCGPEIEGTTVVFVEVAADVSALISGSVITDPDVDGSWYPLTISDPYAPPPTQPSKISTKHDPATHEVRPQYFQQPRYDGVLYDWFNDWNARLKSANSPRIAV